jgi:hypothetical protein
LDKISFNIKKSNTVSPSLSSKGNIRANLRNPDKVYVKELFFSNHYEFPAIGESDKLYIATDENAQYRYDELDHAYHCVGRDPEDIEAIQIRLKEDT